MIYPFYRMKEAGYEVVLIGPKADCLYKGKHGYPIKSDVDIDSISAEVS